MEWARFRGHLSSWRGGGVHNAEVETAVPGGIPTADGRAGSVRTYTGRAGSGVRAVGRGDTKLGRAGRIHRYGQKKDCLIFNFVASNTKEGRSSSVCSTSSRRWRDALDVDAVFNVVGEVLPAARIGRVLRDYYAGRLGDDDLEDRVLRDVDEKRFRDICGNALEGLASKKLNLEMLGERRARARERRVVPETISRFLRDAAPLARLKLDIVGGLPHTFEPGRPPASLRRYEREPDWKLPELAVRYPRCSTDRDTAQKHTLEWVTPGHPLFGNGKQKRDPCGHLKRDPPVSVNSSVHDLLPWRLFRGCSDLADGLTLAVHIVTCALRSHSRARRVRLSADAPGGVRNRPP